VYVRSKRRPHPLLVSSIGMTTPGHDLDRYRRLRVIPRTRDPRIRSNARDAHGNPDLLADLALRWVDEAVDGWDGRAVVVCERVDRDRVAWCTDGQVELPPAGSGRGVPRLLPIVSAIVPVGERTFPENFNEPTVAALKATWLRQPLATCEMAPVERADARRMRRAGQRAGTKSSGAASGTLRAFFAFSYLRIFTASSSDAALVPPLKSTASSTAGVNEGRCP